MRSLVATVAIAVAVVACGGDASETTTTQSPAPVSTLDVSTTSTASPDSTVAAAANTGTFATIEEPPDNQNWLQASVQGGQSLAEEPELCLILNEGAGGKINTVNFALDWSDGAWTLIWIHTGGRYEGPVDGTVDGLTVAFEGEAGGMAVRGSVTCVEP